MNWLLRRTVDLADRLALWYSSRKYGTLAESMGRDTDAGPAGRRGFIVIQIDGLAHEYLVEAMAQGYAPTLRRLWTSGEAVLERWRCGVPSSTPAVQAGIMFGNSWDVPSFRWYEKDTGRSVVCKLPALVRQLQERLSAGRQGILRGGSSYVNMFDGSARLSLFTLAAWGRDRFFENVRGFGFVLLFLLSPWRVMRTMASSVWEYLRDLWKRLISRWQPGPSRRFTLLSPLLQTMVNVVFREIETFGVVLDIYRGVPSIWANYFGYDEVAHHLGPRSRDALRALRGLDRKIREIDHIRRQYRRCEYDLFVMSDHGQTPSIPFRQLHDMTLGEYISSQIGEAVALDESWGEVYHALQSAGFLLDELKGLERETHRSKRTRAMMRALRRWVEERVPPDPELGWDLQRRSDVVVRSSGSLAHVYFNVTPERMDLDEVAVLYPQLLARLVEEASIGLILGRSDGHPAILTRQGVSRLDDQRGGPTVPTLLQHDEPEWAASQLARLASYPHSGDLILLGAWDGDGSLVCFEDHWASHGGLGGQQDYPFMLSPGHLDWEVGSVCNAEELYPCFLRTYAGGAGDNLKEEKQHLGQGDAAKERGDAFLGPRTCIVSQPYDWASGAAV